MLRIWEYTGQARRGYFVEGLSGAQFIRGSDYQAVVRLLQNPQQELCWVNAADPAQCWGKILAHQEGRSFLNVPGNAAACYAGLPVAVMERQGKVLRIFEPDMAAQILELFVKEYRAGRIFPALNRIVVKEYPQWAAGALAGAGFQREMRDYVLYI